MSVASPVVSVVVPTLDRPAELAEALASIAGQTGIDRTEIEVLVVNDGGRPIGDVVATARDHGLGVRLLDHPRRRGLSSARNTGIDHARGTYLAFLDDDDVFGPRHLATALAGLESGADLVATTCLVADHRVTPATMTTNTASEGVVEWDVDFDPVLLEACNLFPVHTAVFRSVSASTARFDPALPAVEDWDFWLRLTRQHHYTVTRIPEPTVVYHRLPQTESMISAVAAGPAAMADFSALVRRTWSRWPATTARSQRFRLYTAIMYWHVLGRLTTGQPLNPHYYLHSIHALAHAWRDPAAEADMPERLARIVKGDDVHDRHAA